RGGQVAGGGQRIRNRLEGEDRVEVMVRLVLIVKVVVHRGDLAVAEVVDRGRVAVPACPGDRAEHAVGVDHPVLVDRVHFQQLDLQPGPAHEAEEGQDL